MYRRTDRKGTSLAKTNDTRGKLEKVTRPYMADENENDLVAWV